MGYTSGISFTPSRCPGCLSLCGRACAGPQSRRPPRTLQGRVLDAGESVQVEDAPDRGRVSEPVTDVLRSGRRRLGRGARRQGRLLLGGEGTGTRGCAAPGQEGRGAARTGTLILGGGVGDHEELVAAQVHHDPGVRPALGASSGGVLFRRPGAAGASGRGTARGRCAGAEAGWASLSPPWGRGWWSRGGVLGGGNVADHVVRRLCDGGTVFGPGRVEDCVGEVDRVRPWRWCRVRDGGETLYLRRSDGSSDAIRVDTAQGVEDVRVEPGLVLGGNGQIRGAAAGVVERGRADVSSGQDLVDGVAGPALRADRTGPVPLGLPAPRRQQQ